MFKLTTLAAAALVVGGLSLVANDAARASDGPCGYFAFAGAYKNYTVAQRKAKRIGAVAMDLDSSDSSNAGKGYWVVAVGPGSKSWAKRQSRKLQRRGGGSTYVAARCIWG